MVDGRLRAVPRGVMAAGNVMQGARGGVDMPGKDVDRVKSHLAKYYAKMGDTAPGTATDAAPACRQRPRPSTLSTGTSRVGRALGRSTRPGDAWTSRP